MQRTKKTESKPTLDVFLHNNLQLIIGFQQHALKVLWSNLRDDLGFFPVSSNEQHLLQT